MSVIRVDALLLQFKWPRKHGTGHYSALEKHWASRALPNLRLDGTQKFVGRNRAAFPPFLSPHVARSFFVVGDSVETARQLLLRCSTSRIHAVVCGFRPTG